MRPLIREGIFDPEKSSPRGSHLVSCLYVVDHMPDPLAALRGEA
ncbi:MAG: hypothetical protein ACR2J6_02280 [Thermoleophilaceae bacterium]